MDDNNIYKSPLPYPPIDVSCENSLYADIIQQNFAGAVSEFSAVSQYVNHELRLNYEYEEISKALHCISIVEMHHLEILGLLIIKLGGNPGYWSIKKRKRIYWSPNFVNYGEIAEEMIEFDIRDEYAAIRQYSDSIKIIKDTKITDIIKRIIIDEKIHIEILTNLKRKYLYK